MLDIYITVGNETFRYSTLYGSNAISVHCSAKLRAFIQGSSRGLLQSTGLFFNVHLHYHYKTYSILHQAGFFSFYWAQRQIQLNVLLIFIIGSHFYIYSHLQSLAETLENTVVQLGRHYIKTFLKPSKQWMKLTHINNPYNVEDAWPKYRIKSQRSIYSTL